jgi:hypothetical protein
MFGSSARQPSLRPCALVLLSLTYDASCITTSRVRTLVLAMLFGLPSAEMPSRRIECGCVPS